jgi:hypothetical protein
MGQLSTYAQDKILDHILKVAAYTPATHLYLGLSTADPLEDGSGLTEPSSGAYARVICDDWEIANLRKTRNATELVFTAASNSWGTMTHWAIFDHISSGNMIAFGELYESKNVVTGIVVSVLAGDIEIAFNTGAISTYLANAILDHVFLNDAYTPATHIYVALATETIFDSDSGSTITEPTDTYARVLQDDWNATDEGASSNDGEITFAIPSVSWGEITDIALVDALTNGHVLLFGVLTTALEVNAGDDPVEFADEILVITLT